MLEFNWKFRLATVSAVLVSILLVSVLLAFVLTVNGVMFIPFF